MSKLNSKFIKTEVSKNISAKNLIKPNKDIKKIQRAATLNKNAPNPQVISNPIDQPPVRDKKKKLKPSHKNSHSISISKTSQLNNAISNANLIKNSLNQNNKNSPIGKTGHKRNKSLNSLNVINATNSSGKVKNNFGSENLKKRPNFIEKEIKNEIFENYENRIPTRSKFYSQSILEPSLESNSLYKNTLSNNTFSSNETSNQINTVNKKINQDQNFNNLDIISPQNPVQQYLLGSLNIINRIQNNLEKGHDQNYKNFQEKNNFISNESDIHLSNQDKEQILNNIVSTSDQRLQNYSNLFEIINNSLSDIKECLLSNPIQKSDPAPQKKSKIFLFF